MTTNIDTALVAETLIEFLGSSLCCCKWRLENQVIVDVGINNNDTCAQK